MKSSDITLTLFILMVFLVLFMFNILSVGIKNIQDNWPTYRCNPMIMPFASMFGQDTMSNFTFCIQNMQTNYMDFLLQPINYNLNLVTNMGGTLTEAINSARAFIDNLRSFITDLIQNVFAVFLNILVEFQRIMVDLKDMTGKLAGILATLLYTVDGSIMVMGSVWNGAPGGLVRAFQNTCFHPDTLVTLKDNTLCPMKDLPLNIELKNGTIVKSVMRLSNINNSEITENIYALKGGNDTTIYVSGTHLIYDPEQSQFIYVNTMADLYPNKCVLTKLLLPELYCLITSTHTIPIGEWIFHDWEDNNGSSSKSLDS